MRSILKRSKPLSKKASIPKNEKKLIDDNGIWDFKEEDRLWAEAGFVKLHPNSKMHKQIIEYMKSRQNTSV